MKLFDEIVTIDFESEAIDGALPPKPVGVAIKVGAAAGEYFAWGHAAGNNCTLDDVLPRLRQYFMHHECLFHNASFDIAVAKHHLGLPFPTKLHDSLLLLFLHDPHAKTLALKPSAEHILGLPPEEQDFLKEWILLNVKEAKPSTYGAYICRVPGKLVAEYAIGDVDRTYKLFKLLYPLHGGEAYLRERKLLPILVQNTLEGVRLDEKRLIVDCMKYTTIHHEISKRVYSKLGMSFNIDSADELVAAITKAGIPAEWVLTPTGKKSTAKKNLMAAIKDEELLVLLNYRGTLSTYLETFYNAWINKAVNGVLHFSWNQVRNNEAGKDAIGTRTGRLSSSPSMLNVPKQGPRFDERWRLQPLPTMRSYLLPDREHLWLKRDYSSQELRVLAHYEDDQLMRAYNANPLLDLHQMMAELVTTILGRPLSRRAAKTLAFSILYGSGLDLLAMQLDCSRAEAGECKAAYLQALPGIKAVQSSLKYSWDRGAPIKTWGGRLYYKEPSREIVDRRTGGTRYADFGYKALNYLIQGSSADVTKQAMINYNEIKKDGRFLLSVHDEINISGPPSEMKLLNEAMNDIAIDVPMNSDGAAGATYGQLETFEEEA